MLIIKFFVIKTSTQLVLGGAAAVLIYSLVRKGKAAGTINFFPDKVKSFFMDGITPTLKVGIGAQNTSNQSFTINSMAGNLYDVKPNSNTYIGNINDFVAQTIMPNSQTIIIVYIRLQLIGIANDIIDIIENGNFHADLLLKGYVNVDQQQIPLNEKYSIGI